MHKNVEQYIEYFCSELENIKKVPSQLHQKILFVTLLDALSRGRFSEEKMRNSERFTRLILAHGEWGDAERVSLPMLRLELEERKKVLKRQGGAEEVLLQFVLKRLTDWGSGGPIPISRDPKQEEMEAVNSPEKENNILRNMRHINLIYRYRTTLVHEYREPGYAIETRIDSEPFYATSNDRWELGYPTAFFVGLAGRIICNLFRYYSEEQINPYGRHRFGSLWRGVA
jgi:hypothetical protein